MMRRHVRFLALICAVFLPSAVFAQGTLAGVVRDTTGAVLPGVTVEAASFSSSRESGRTTACPNTQKRRADGDERPVEGRSLLIHD
jgi:hypothetical protein